MQTTTTATDKLVASEDPRVPRHTHKSEDNWSSSSSDEDSSKKRQKKRSKKSKKEKKKHKHHSSSESEPEYGPVFRFAHVPASQEEFVKTNYGGNLLSGEGEALAAFARNNERIPRRGEVGWSGEKIKQFEELGYVMSGSRHKRMEAVRKRKENQVVTGEEKRLMIINETKKKNDKEAKVLEELHHLIKKREYEEAGKKA